MNMNKEKKNIVVDEELVNKIINIEKTFRSGKPKKKDVKELARYLGGMSGQIFRGVEVYKSVQSEMGATWLKYMNPKCEEDDVVVSVRNMEVKRGQSAKHKLSDIMLFYPETATELVAGIRSALETKLYYDNKAKVERRIRRQNQRVLETENV